MKKKTARDLSVRDLASVGFHLDEPFCKANGGTYRVLRDGDIVGSIAGRKGRVRVCINLDNPTFGENVHVMSFGDTKSRKGPDAVGYGTVEWTMTFSANTPADVVLAALKTAPTK